MSVGKKGACLQVVKLTLLHGVLYAFVILYLLLGAHIFLRLEGDNATTDATRMQKRIHTRLRLQDDMRQLVRDMVDYNRSHSAMAEMRLLGFIRRVQQAGINVDELEHTVAEYDQIHPGLQLADCVLFAFTIVSTIGMLTGNVSLLDDLL